MPETISEIMDSFNSFRNDVVWTELKQRMEGDFELYRLKKYDAGSKYVSFTSNMPRITADKAIGMLLVANLIIRIPLDYLRAEEQDEAANVERLCYGLFNLNDRRFRRLALPTTKEQMAWYLILRGGCFARPYIYKDKKTGDTTVSIAIWDRYNTAYEMGGNGLEWAIHARRASKAAIKSEYGIDIEGHKDSVLYDYWDGKKNSVVIGAINEWAKPPTKHNVGYTPVFQVLAGAMPRLWQDDDTLVNKHVGESIFVALRGLAPIKNKTMSDRLTMVRRATKSPIATFTEDGEGIGEEDIWSVEEGHLIDLKKGEGIEQVFKPEMSRETDMLLGELSIEEQLAGFPRTAYGQLAFRLSGLAINQLKDAIGGVIQPFVGGLEYGYTMIVESLLDQYAGKKWKPIKIRGRTSRGEAFGYPAGQEIAPSDIKQQWYPEVKLEPILPEDDPQNVYMARLVKEAGLMADEDIMDKFLGVEDTNLAKNKLEAQWASNIPSVKLHRLFDALIERREFRLAALIWIELQKLLRAEQGMEQGGGKQMRSPTRQEAASMEQPGMGMPVRGAGGKIGLPPEVLPPEALGGVPPAGLGEGT